jgi:uncharacterized protein YjcR
VEIANILETPEKNISGWKVKDIMEMRIKRSTPTKIRSYSKRKKERGAPKGSKNALGNKGGHGGPVEKKKQRIWIFLKYLPEDNFRIIEAIDEKEST